MQNRPIRKTRRVAKVEHFFRAARRVKPILRHQSFREQKKTQRVCRRSGRLLKIQVPAPTIHPSSPYPTLLAAANMNNLGHVHEGAL
jgi:hypothetical protein